jgi:hypothetical protein
MNGRNRRIHGLGLGGLLLAGLAAGACSSDIHTSIHEGHHAYQGEGFTVDVVSANVGGKNVFIPSTIVVAGGRANQLSVYNATEAPHGFAIEGLGVEVVLQPGVETLVPLPAVEGGRVYRIHCQLHPPHRNGTLVVLPAE